MPDGECPTHLQLSLVQSCSDVILHGDLEAAYHLSLWAGCGGGLQRCWGPFILAPGQVEWHEGLMPNLHNCLWKGTGSPGPLL